MRMAPVYIPALEMVLSVLMLVARVHQGSKDLQDCPVRLAFEGREAIRERKENEEKLDRRGRKEIRLEIYFFVTLYLTL